MLRFAYAGESSIERRSVVSEEGRVDSENADGALEDSESFMPASFAPCFSFPIPRLL